METGARRYDWSCWLMHARYNCQGDRRGAELWRHVVDVNASTQRTWRDVVDGYGGHVAVAEELAARCGTRDRPRPVNVVLVGHSFLRQVFEALACRWRHRITAGLLNRAAPNLQMAHLRQFKRRGNAHDAAAYARRRPRLLAPMDRGDAAAATDASVQVRNVCLERKRAAAAVPRGRAAGERRRLLQARIRQRD